MNNCELYGTLCMYKQCILGPLPASWEEPGYKFIRTGEVVERRSYLMKHFSHNSAFLVQLKVHVSSYCSSPLTGDCLISTNILLRIVIDVTATECACSILGIFVVTVNSQQVIERGGCSFCS